MAETKKPRVDTPARREIASEIQLLEAITVASKANLRIDIGMSLESIAPRFGFDARDEYLVWFKNFHEAVMFDKALSLHRAEGKLTKIARQHG